MYQLMTPLIQKIIGFGGIGGAWPSLAEMLAVMGGITAAVYILVKVMNYHNARTLKP